MSLIPNTLLLMPNPAVHTCTERRSTRRFDVLVTALLLVIPIKTALQEHIISVEEARGNVIQTTYSADTGRN
eukprot:9241309-Ditylum_brightwellii.AAC.1